MWHIEIDFYLLKSLMKLFINAGVLSDLDSTVDYSKKPVLDSILKPPGSNKIGPRFVKTGAEWALWPPGGLGAGAI